MSLNIGFIIVVMLISAIYSLMFVIVDFITSMLIRATGQKLMSTCHQSMQLLKLSKMVEASGEKILIV